MYRPSASVVSADTYSVGAKPYDIGASLAAVMAELAQRRKKASAPRPRPMVVDQEAARQKAEAEAAKREAARILASAKEDSHRMIDAAMAESVTYAEKAKEEGFSQGLETGTTEGYEKGLRQGEEEGLGKWAELRARWEGLLDATVAEKERYFADRERILVELVMRVSAKVLGREIKQSQGDIRALVQDAIRHCNDRSRLMVHLSPEDFAKATEGGAEAVKAGLGVKHIEFLADDKIMAGGVRVESGIETVDAGMESKLTELIKGLLKEAYHAD